MAKNVQEPNSLGVKTGGGALNGEFTVPHLIFFSFENFQVILEGNLIIKPLSHNKNGGSSVSIPVQLLKNTGVYLFYCSS